MIKEYFGESLPRSEETEASNYALRKRIQELKAELEATQRELRQQHLKTKRLFNRWRRNAQ